MKVAVMGSALLNDETKMVPLIAAAVDSFNMRDITILTGDNKGTDRCAYVTAYRRGWDCVVFRPIYEQDKRLPEKDRYWFLNYAQMIHNADKLILVSNKAKGGEEDLYEDLVRLAQKNQIPVLRLVV